MDPVSRLLAERERRRLRLTPYVAAAVALHGAIAAALFLAGRYGHTAPAHLPAVSVRLVRPSPAPSARRAAPRTTPAPAPTRAAPTAAPSPVATAPPVPTRAAEPPASADAMPDVERRHTPAAEPTVPPGEPAGAGGGRGLSLGDGTGGAPAGIPSDFQFTYYVDRMLALIESRWYKPPSPRGTRARARFRILRDGRLEAIVLEESSGQPTFDRAVLRALYAANPLPPLPPAYRKDSLTVHLSFTE